MLTNSYRRILSRPILRCNTFHVSQFSFCAVHSQMCYYEVLNLSRTASIAEIKNAYYDKVKQYHPDHNTSSSAEENFKVIVRAYEVLRDPTLRRQYDTKISDNTTNQTRSNYYNKNDSEGYSRTNTAYSSYNSSFYGNYRDDNSSKKAYNYHEAWQAHSYREKAEENWRSAQYKAPTQRNQSFFDSLVVKIGMVVGVFFLIDMYKRTKGNEESQPVKAVQAKIDPMSLGQVDFGATMGWGRRMSDERLHEEMKKKGFRIEYRMVQSNLSPEAKKARKIYRKEKKIENMDEFMEKREFKLVKSKQH